MPFTGDEVVLRNFSSRNAWFWILSAFFWGGALIVGLTTTRIFATRPSAETLIVCRSLFGFSSSAVIHYVIGKPCFRKMPQVKRWIAGWLLSLVLCALAIPLLYPIHLGLALESHEMIRLIIPRFFVMTAWLVMYFGIQAADEYFSLMVRQLKLDKARLSQELSLLQAQIAPHFLFNSLNAILANKDDPAKVVDVTESLAEFLRFSLRQTRPMERLGVELNALEPYLCVHQHRFGERLECSMEYDVASRGTLVPTLIVQPLLENAIIYGKASSDGVLQIRVSALCDAGRLLIQVRNTGEWLTPDPDRSSGTGLANLRRRLRLIYQDTANLTFGQDEGWVTAIISLPISPVTS